MATVQKFFVLAPPSNSGNFVANASSITWEKTTCNGREALRATYDDELVGSGDLVNVMGESGFGVDEPT